MSDEALCLQNGLMSTVIEMPIPWPVGVPMTMIEHRLKDGLLLLGVAPDGTFEAALGEGSGPEYRIIHHVKTRKILVKTELPAIIMIAWDARKICQFVFGRENNALEPGPDIIHEGEFDGWTGIDFSERSEGARKARAEAAQLVSDKPDRRKADDDYLFSALRDEIDQVEDLVTAIEAGRDAHVPGLAARIRLLIADKPLGLLSRCAGLLGLPLIVYTSRDPELLPPEFEKMVSMIPGGLSAQSSPLHRNPIDLDLWLEMRAIIIKGRLFTNRTVIKSIADTIGAHRDPQIPEVVDVINLWRTQQSERYRDVAKYVVTVAKVVASVGRELISATAPGHR